jgi:hypothetical protein
MAESAARHYYDRVGLALFRLRLIKTLPFVSSEVETPGSRAQQLGLAASLEAIGSIQNRSTQRRGRVTASQSIQYNFRYSRDKNLSPSRKYGAASA